MVITYRALKGFIKADVYLWHFSLLNTKKHRQYAEVFILAHKHTRYMFDFLKSDNSDCSILLTGEQKESVGKSAPILRAKEAKTTCLQSKHVQFGIRSQVKVAL